MYKNLVKQVQGHKLNQSQQVGLTILGASTEKIEEIVANEFDENPFLEYEESYRSQDDDFFSSVLETYHEPKNLKNILQEQVFQAAYMHVDQLLYLANSVDDFGYLPIDIYEVFSSEFKDASNNDFISALCVLQSFEPSGVGARTLSECLLIQLQDEANLQLIEKICTNHLPDVAIRDYELIAKTLQVEEEAILLAIEQIKLVILDLDINS